MIDAAIGIESVSNASSSLVVRNARVITSNLTREAILLDIDSGVYFGLDPVGRRIWHLLEQPTSITEIRDQLLLEYDVEPVACEKAIGRFLEKLSARNMVTVVP